MNTICNAQSTICRSSQNFPSPKAYPARRSQRQDADVIFFFARRDIFYPTPTWASPSCNNASSLMHLSNLNPNPNPNRNLEPPNESKQAYHITSYHIISSLSYLRENPPLPLLSIQIRHGSGVKYEAVIVYSFGNCVMCWRWVIGEECM